MDITSVSALLGSLKTATEIAKFIRTSDVSIEKAETKLKLADLVSALADAKLEAAEVQQLLLERDERIRSLESEARIRAAVVWREPAYWLKNPEEVEEPFCQGCYDDSGKLARLHSDGSGLFECRVCNKSFKSQERKSRDSARMKTALSAQSQDAFGG